MTRAMALSLLVASCGGTIAPDTIADPVHDAAVDVAKPILDASKPEVTVVEASASDVVTPFSPASLGNLVLWLDANVGVKEASGHVVGWTDASPKKNDAGASTTYAPTLAQKSVNGLPAIHFDKSAIAYMLVADTASLRFGTGDYLLAFVARFTNDPSGGDAYGAPCFFFKSTYQNGTGAGLGVWGNVPLSNGTVQSGFLVLEDAADYAVDTNAYFDGVARSFVVRRVGTTVTLRVNGATTATVTESAPIDVSASGQPVIIGALAQTYYRIIGDLAEMVALNGTTADTDVTTLEAYLMKKFAL